MATIAMRRTKDTQVCLGGDCCGDRKLCTCCIACCRLVSSLRTTPLRPVQVNGRPLVALPSKTIHHVQASGQSLNSMHCLVPHAGALEVAVRVGHSFALSS